MYLTYDEYQNMGGTLDEATFNDLAFDAQAKIDWYTFRRLAKEEEIPEAVKRCMYRLIKLLYDASQAMMVDSQSGEGSSVRQAGIASQSNDGVSISYNTLSAKDMLDASTSEIELCIRQYLQGITNSLGKKLTYRGLYPDE